MSSFGFLVRASGLTPNHLASAFGCRRDSVTDFLSGRREPSARMRQFVAEVGRLVEHQVFLAAQAVEAGHEYNIPCLVDPTVMEMIAGRLLVRYGDNLAIERVENGTLIAYKVQA